MNVGAFNYVIDDYGNQKNNTIFVSLVKVSPVSLESNSVSLYKDPETVC